METTLLTGGRDRQRRFRLDPRTKLFILLAVNSTVLLSPGLLQEFSMTLLILLLGLVSGVYRYTLAMTALYLLLAAAQVLGALYLADGLQVFLVTFVMFLRKIFPCAMVGGIFIATTRVNEFMAAMHKLRLPKSLVIPLAVMLRYFPAVREEWGHIRDAMNMRGLAASFTGLLKAPLKTIECVYVPLLFSAARLADELAAAAVTRGIDNPAPRTCVERLGLTAADGLWAGSFMLLLLLVIKEVAV